ncbi:UNVERIFIED_CONTAM: hypothetical protein GTU68_022024 [Idotea baltica]|nr:hypothetical protein [Idotea baltica]
MLADEVNVYSYRQPELVEPLFAAFTAETGIKVNTVFLNKGMAERLKAEGSRSPADLAFTTDIGRLSALQDADVLQPYTSDTLEANVPAQFRDPDGLWTGLTTRARAVYASKDRVSEEAITYEDLASDTWKGRICTRSGLHAYQVALTAAVIEKYDEATAKTWLEGLKSNLARKPQGNDRAQVKAVSEGVCDIAIGNTYYMALMLKDAEQKAWADAVRIIFPTFEDGGTHVNISGVALTKAAPNRDNAIKLIEFLTSPEGQSLYAQVNDEYPVSPGITSPSVISSFGSFDADDASLQDIVAARPAAIRITEEVDYDG